MNSAHLFLFVEVVVGSWFLGRTIGISLADWEWRRDHETHLTADDYWIPPDVEFPTDLWIDGAFATDLYVTLPEEPPAE